MIYFKKFALLTRPFFCCICLCFGLQSVAHAQKAWPPDIPEIDTEAGDEYLGGVVFPRLFSSYSGDPTYDVSKSFNEGGRLVYFIQLLDDGHANWFFVFRDQLSDAQLAANPIMTAPIATYGCGANDFFANPQFSPDLQTLMFQSGDYASTHGFHVPCYWDFAGRTIRRAENTFINYPEEEFSPDSQYIGFYLGGDRYGTWDDTWAPPHLYAQNIHTGKLFQVSKQEGVSPWAWTSAGTILYRRLITQPQTVDQTEYATPYDSQIREHNLVAGTDKPLIEHGWLPSPSPDNRYIAFSACLEPEVEAAAEGGAVPAPATNKPDGIALLPNRLNRTQLSLYDRETKQVLPLEPAMPATKEALTFTWSQDSKTLIVTRFSGPKSKEHCSIKTLSLDSTLATAGRKEIPVWKSVAEFDIASQWPQGVLLTLEVKKITRNGRYLILNVQDYSRLETNATLETLEAVDLESGEIRVLARKPSDLNSSLGWDWIELPEKPTQPPKP